jgi:hypothetical protein
VTNALFASLHRLMVGPVSLTTTPVPFRKKRARHERNRVASKDRRASACGSATVVSLRLHSCALPPALHFPVRRTAGRSLAEIYSIRRSRFNSVQDCFGFDFRMICKSPPLANNVAAAQNLRVAKSTASQAHRKPFRAD